MTPQEAACAALEAHSALRDSDAREPELDDEGMPLDPGAWVRWRDEENKPAYQRWSDAMDALSVTLGYDVGRHPYTFRPICEAILAGEEVPA